MNTENWKKDYEEFEKVTRQFYAGEVSVPEYKGFSGGFGSYAQRGGKASMLRLRLPGGRVTKDKLKFVVDSIRKYNIDKVHFTTCQTIQLHNLNADAVCEIAVAALDHGIVTRGGGGDFPRNVMVSPLSGVEQGEYFDVSPYAEAAAEYLMTLIKTVKLPRKLKVCFSNSPANRTHATFRDLGFVAREDGTFDVYSAGGLGNNARMGVLVAENVEGSKILYYIKAMVDMFTTYGNYENRAKARTRYMQDVLGDKYAEEFQKKLDAVFASGVNMDIPAEKIAAEEAADTPMYVTKTGDGSAAEGWRVIPQKQEGLYAVEYHPIGGCPAPEKLVEIYEAIKDMDGVELRVAPDETVYIINCTGAEAEKVLAVTDDGAANLFETSVACIGSSICQVGVRGFTEASVHSRCRSQRMELPGGNPAAHPHFRLPFLLRNPSDRTHRFPRWYEEGRRQTGFRLCSLCQRKRRRTGTVRRTAGNYSRGRNPCIYESAGRRSGSQRQRLRDLVRGESGETQRNRTAVFIIMK